MNDMRDMIVALRGGIPAVCDFCGSTNEPENMEPEEAGQWACIECVKRWEKEDRATTTRNPQ